MNQPRRLNKKFHLTWGTLAFLVVHLGCLMVFIIPVDRIGIALCMCLFLVRGFSISAGFHRYFAHRSYKTNRFFQFCLAFMGGTCGQKGVLWWVAHHRHHHRHSDTDRDIHSVQQDGFYWSHVGWMLSREYHAAYDPGAVQDLARYPELVWLDKNHLFPLVLLAALCYMAHGWIGLVWGFLLSTVILYHTTFAINSICHMVGSRPFQTGEASRNTWWLSLFTLGESWHNNHHHAPHSSRSGFHWWQIDLTYLGLQALSWFRIVRDLKVPASKRI